MSNPTLDAWVDEARRTRNWGLSAGVVAAIICIIGAFFSPAQFFRAYLTAWFFFLGIALGCLVILQIFHLTGGAWGLLIQRILEAGTRTLPLLALLFIPVGCGLGYLYIWAHPDEVQKFADLQRKQIYLNPVSFWIRAVVYFAIWNANAWTLSYWSRRHDETGDPAYVRRMTRISGPGLIVFGITVTFAAVDWVMSLEPKFHSTIFGPLVATGQVVSAHAVGLIVLAWIGPRSRINNVMSLQALNDLGNLMFTFLILWAYMVWFQFMLIWIANLPYEVLWYLPRSHNGWQWVAWALFVFHFVIPFFLLLMRDVKQHLPTLAKTAGLLLFMQLVYTYYLIMPEFTTTTIGDHWMDFIMPIAVGGFWLANFMVELPRRPLVARDVEDRLEAERLRHLEAEAANRPGEVTHA